MNRLYQWLLQKKNKLIIRLVGSRDHVYHNKHYRSLWLAQACRLYYEKSIIRVLDGKEVRFNIRYDCIRVNLPEIKNALYMAAIKGFSGKLLMLLNITSQILNNTAYARLAVMLAGYFYKYFSYLRLRKYLAIKAACQQTTLFFLIT